jgi:hypothetical protein
LRPGRFYCGAARWASQVLDRGVLSKIGIAKTNGLSNPRLSPLAHAAADAALLRTDEIPLLFGTSDTFG